LLFYAHLLPAFEVLETFILNTTVHSDWNAVVAQPYSWGITFNMGDLPTASAEVLHAFSHFTYEFSEESTVLVNFQGL
jgi:hypothetical protein